MGLRLKIMEQGASEEAAKEKMKKFKKEVKDEGVPTSTLVMQSLAELMQRADKTERELMKNKQMTHEAMGKLGLHEKQIKQIKFGVTTLDEKQMAQDRKEVEKKVVMKGW